MANLQVPILERVRTRSISLFYSVLLFNVGCGLWFAGRLWASPPENFGHRGPSVARMTPNICTTLAVFSPTLSSTPEG